MSSETSSPLLHRTYYGCYGLLLLSRLQLSARTHLCNGRDRRCSHSSTRGKGNNAWKAITTYCTRVVAHSTVATRDRCAQSRAFPIMVRLGAPHSCSVNSQAGGEPLVCYPQRDVAFGDTPVCPRPLQRACGLS